MDARPQDLETSRPLGFASSASWPWLGPGAPIVLPPILLAFKMFLKSFAFEDAFNSSWCSIVPFSIVRVSPKCVWPVVVRGVL